MATPNTNATASPIRIVRLQELAWGYIVAYRGPLNSFLAAGFMPTEVFDVGRSRKMQVGAEGFRKRTGKAYPPDVDLAVARVSHKGAVHLTLYVHRHPREALYVPEGDVWPTMRDSRFESIDRYGNRGPVKARTAEIRAAGGQHVIDFAAYKKRREKETDHMEQAITRIMTILPGFTREQAIRQIEHATLMRQARMECNDE